MFSSNLFFKEKSPVVLPSSLICSSGADDTDPQNIMGDTSLTEGNKNDLPDENIVKGDFHSIYYANLDTFNNKKAELIDLINNENPDILAFTELLNKKCPVITKAELKLNGYDEFYNDDDENDKVNKRRGVVLYTKTSLNAKSFNVFDKYNFREHVWCSFKTVNEEKVLIGVVYHSGSSTVDNTDNMYKILKDESFNTFDRVVICGDFNFPTAKWDGSWSSDVDEGFYEAVREGFFTQHVTKPTRYRDGQKANILDLVFTRDENDINSIHYCSPLGKSDHILLKIITTIPISEEKQSFSEKLDWKKGDYM